MKNTIKLAFTFLFLMLVSSLYAQKSRYQEITEKRVEYIAPRLDLNAKEAQQFWPLFRAYYAEREKLSENAKNRNEQGERERPETEEEFLNAINLMIESKILQAQLLKEYNDKYLDIMSAKKVHRVFQLDDEFNRNLLNQLKGNRPKRK